MPRRAQIRQPLPCSPRREPLSAAQFLLLPMEAFHNLLQLSGYSTASAACCACGALSAAPEPPRRFRRRPLQPVRAAGGVRVGGVLARLLWPPIPPRHRPVLDVGRVAGAGREPLPQPVRRLPGVLRHGGGLRARRRPARARARRLRRARPGVAAAPAALLRLQPRAAAPERRRRGGGLRAAAARAAAAAAAAGRRGLRPRRAARSLGVDGAEPDLNDLSRLGRKLGTPGMRSVGGEQLLNATSCAYTAVLAAARPIRRPAALGGGARRARARRPAASPYRSLRAERPLLAEDRAHDHARDVGEAHAVVVRVGVGRAFEVALGQYDLLQAAAVT